MSDELSGMNCTPCKGGIPPLSRDEAEALLVQAPGWLLTDAARRLERSFLFGNFREAFGFVVAVGELAEAQGHHPDISFGWGWATVIWQTKKIKGLHENDFIMAAKTSALVDSAKP